jgi:CSLREA domain-containing protein
MPYVRLFIAAIAIAVLALSLGGTVSYAGGTQTFAVTRNDDPAPDGCNLNGCSLREAILAANDTVDADAITVPAMHITLSIAGTGEDAGQTGDLDITHDVTINGAGVDQTIVDADQIDRVFDIPTPVVNTPSEAEVRIDNLNVMAGSNAGIRNTGNLYLDHVTVLGNSDQDQDGGGIFSPLGVLEISSSTIFKNSTMHAGGGIAADGEFLIGDSTVYANSAKDGGGGIFTDGHLSMVNTTVHGNSVASGQGGGVYVGPSVSFIINSTIANNTSSAAGGGAFSSSEDISMSNTIISGNSGGNAPDCSGTFLGNNNLVKNASNCTLSGEDNITGQDPLLFDLANYGGPTQTRAIPDTSPAFDAGDAVSCLDADQRGVPRIQVNGCDIGAFEFTFVGDVDCDGVVVTPDITALLGAVAGAAIPACIYRGDINCNLGYEGLDVLFLLRHLAHLSEMTRPLSCPEIGPDPLT